MPFVAANPHERLGEVVDNGHCMRHVQIIADVTHSSTLREGANVRATQVAPGTVIGTFDNQGRYANATDGSSHVAIFVSKDDTGITVVDQWVGQPVHERVIRYKGSGPACDDGTRFHVVEVIETA